MASNEEITQILGGLIKRMDENAMKEKEKKIKEMAMEMEMEKKEKKENMIQKNIKKRKDILITIAVDEEDIVHSIAPRMIVEDDGKTATLIMYVERNAEDDLMMEGDEYNVVDNYAESEGHAMKNYRFWYYWDNYFEETMREAMVGFMDEEKWKRDRKALGDSRDVIFANNKHGDRLANILFTEHKIPLKLKKNH